MNQRQNNTNNKKTQLNMKLNANVKAEIKQPMNNKRQTKNTILPVNGGERNELVQAKSRDQMMMTVDKQRAEQIHRGKKMRALGRRKRRAEQYRRLCIRIDAKGFKCTEFSDPERFTM